MSALRQWGIVTHAPKLLKAIASVGGDALVLHAGDTPYIATPGGRLPVSSRPLTTQQLTSLIEELLPPAARAALDEAGAVELELPPPTEWPECRFVIVAARVEHELWAELRRYGPKTAGAASHAAVNEGDDLNLPSASELWPTDGSTDES